MSSFEYILRRGYDGKICHFYTDDRIHAFSDIEELVREYDEEKKEYAYVYLHSQFCGPLAYDRIMLKEDEWTQEKENKIINDIIHDRKPGLLNRLINYLNTQTSTN